MRKSFVDRIIDNLIDHDGPFVAQGLHITLALWIAFAIAAGVVWLLRIA